MLPVPSACTPRLAIIGAGSLGLAVARELARRGTTVTCFDPHPGAGATYAAGGMLAPACEAHFHHDRELALGLASRERWPDFAAALQRETGIDLGYHTTGTLLVGFDHDDAEVIWRLAELIVAQGMRAEKFTRRDTRAFAPALAPGIRTGVHIPDDHAVDNRRLSDALLASCTALGVTLDPRRGEVALDGDRVRGVRTADGTVEEFDVVINAAGHLAKEALGDARDLVPCPVFGMKGEILRFDGGADLIPCTVRGVVHRDPVYLIPRVNGIVVGATQDESREDDVVTARGMHTLLRAALELLPEIGELSLHDAVARQRPGTPDQVPLLGATAVEGLFLATGCYRNGILHAPWAAATLAPLILDGVTHPTLEHCRPTRFAADGTLTDVPPKEPVHA